MPTQDQQNALAAKIDERYLRHVGGTRADNDGGSSWLADLYGT